MQHETQTPPPKQGLQTKHIVLILLIVLIIAAAVVTVILLTRDKAPEPVAISNTKVANADNFEEISTEIQEKVKKGMFRTYMTTDWHFADGKSASYDAVMGNADGNNYPIWFEVKRSGSGTLLFESDLLPIGMTIKEIVLLENLPKGEYPAVITVHMLEEDGTEVSGGSANFNITIFIDK
jgi:hypothetical protein